MSNLPVLCFLFRIFPKHGNTLSLMLFNFVLGYALRKVHANQKVLKLNGALQLLAYVDGVTVLGKNMYENT
jgi:Na+/H+-dicarboxylate symporter